MSAAGPPTPADSPLTMADVMASPRHRALMTPAASVGEVAPDFELPLLDPATHAPGDGTIMLSSFAGERPVALVFGSYT